MTENATMDAPTVDADTGESSGKRGAPKKPEFDLSTALDANGESIALDDKGRLTAVPVNFIGDNTHKRLGARNFLHEADYLDYETGNLQVKRDSLITRIERNIQDAADLRAGKTPKGRLLSQREALLAKLEELNESLGMDDDEDLD